MDTNVLHGTRFIGPRYNLAFEEYVLCSRRTGDYLLLCQNDSTIVIGQNQNAAAETNRAFVEEHHIHVVCRTTGSGAAYHDLGNLNVFLHHGCRRRRGHYKGAVHKVDCRRLEGPGTAGGGAEALHVDPAKFRSKSAKSVRSRVGNIREFPQGDMDSQILWAYLKTGLLEGSLSSEELRQGKMLKAEKYDTWEWNFGHAPKYAMTNRRHWNSGTLEAALSVDRGGAVSDISFFAIFRPSVCRSF